jgi:hypothetical protein
MPKAFDNCIKNGGKVRTITGNNPANRKRFGITKSQFIKVCFLDRKMFLGEKKFKKVKRPK